MSSQELNWELGDIFEGGIFAFPVDEPGVARAVIRYLLMRGVLAEEVVDAIEQPGSTADLVAWLGGDERKSMIGVWATAWLNDARRRHDTDRRQQRIANFRSATIASVVVEREGVNNDGGRRSPSPSAVPRRDGAGRRQVSLDSDFGGSEDSTSGGSRKGSIEGVCDGNCEHVTNDEDEIGICALELYKRSNSDDNVLRNRGDMMTPFSGPSASTTSSRVQSRRASRRCTGGIPDRRRSELYDFEDDLHDFAMDNSASIAFPVPIELYDSGNISELTATNSIDCVAVDTDRARTAGDLPLTASADNVSDDCCVNGSDDDVIDSTTSVKQASRVQRQRAPAAASNLHACPIKSCQVSCRCTLSHYTASASMQTVIYAISRHSGPAAAAAELKI